VEFAFSPGLNVIIGKNGTGKTHLLKVLYALLMSKKTVHIPKEISSYLKGVSARLIAAFKANSGL
jgi:Recombinational DNA repair ATPase (RecF pathway)